jgi:mannose-6-phosphate isomerase-like protein (cupin superfamily)
MAATETNEQLWFLDTRVSFPVSFADGADGISVMESWAPHGHSPPLHVHQTEDEIFRVLEGELRFRVADDEVVLGAGDTLLAPKGVPHQFRVESPGGGRWVVLTAHGDFERFVRGCARTDGPAPPDPQALSEAALRHRIEILGPPL